MNKKDNILTIIQIVIYTFGVVISFYKCLYCEALLWLLLVFSALIEMNLRKIVGIQKEIIEEQEAIIKAKEM